MSETLTFWDCQPQLLFFTFGRFLTIKKVRIAGHLFGKLGDLAIAKFLSNLGNLHLP